MIQIQNADSVIQFEIWFDDTVDKVYATNKHFIVVSRWH